VVIVVIVALLIKSKQIGVGVGCGGSWVFFAILSLCVFHIFFAYVITNGFFENNWNRNRKDINKAHDVIVLKDLL
jgi:hypothetical protein